MIIAVMTANEPDGGLALCEGAIDGLSPKSTDTLLPLAANQEQILPKLIRNKQLAGVMGGFISDRWIDSLGARHPPMINISNCSHITRVPSVLVDDVLLGERAATLFHDNDLRDVFCVAQPSLYASVLRERGFCQRATALGLSLHATIPATRPLGIFCTDDTLARRVVAECLTRGDRIPQDVQILGAGATTTDYILSPLPFDTIALPRHAIGRLAVEMLLTWRGTRCIPETRLLPPGPFIHRGSTCALTQRDTLIERATQWMDAHLDIPPNIPMLARACGISRRGLELHFNKQGNGSPAATWRGKQLAKAQALRAETSLTLADIATATGFSSAAHLCARLRNHT